MSIAGIKGVLGLGHSKPERPPPPVSQAELTQLEQDEEADFNAAVQESLKAPTSPRVQSGAQSSSMGIMDLDQRESDLMTQLDKLSVEALRLETATTPSIRDKSRMRTIEGVTDGIVKQLEEIAQQRLRSSSQPSSVQSASPIAAPPVLKPEVSSAPPKAVTPHKRGPLTIETLMQGITGQRDTSAVSSSVFTPALPDEEAQQTAALSERPQEPVRVRSRERTPVRQPRSPTPQKEVQPVFPAIEDGSPPKREVEPELPRERERTPHRERSHEQRQRRRSPSTHRHHSSERRRRSPTPSKDRSHYRRRRSPSLKQDYSLEERQRSPTPPKEQSHRRRRHSPTSSQEHTAQERKSSLTPSRDPSREGRERRERRERRRTPEPA